jgi:hypothetical protein
VEERFSRNQWKTVGFFGSWQNFIFFGCSDSYICCRKLYGSSAMIWSNLLICFIYTAILSDGDAELFVYLLSFSYFELY